MVAGKERNFAIHLAFASKTIDNTHEVEQNSFSIIVNARTSIGALIAVSQAVASEALQTVIAVFLAVARSSTSIDVTRRSTFIRQVVAATTNEGTDSKYKH